MRVCAYKHCFNFNNVHVPGSSCNFTLFQFPKDPIRRQKWLELADVSKEILNEKKELYLCSDHFDKKYFSMSNRRRMLVGEALPFPVNDNINEVNQEMEESEEQQTYLLLETVDEEAHLSDIVDEENNDMLDSSIHLHDVEHNEDSTDSNVSDILKNIVTKSNIKRKNANANEFVNAKHKIIEVGNTTYTKFNQDHKINATRNETHVSNISAKEKIITTAKADTASIQIIEEKDIIDKNHVDSFIFKGEEYVQLRKEYYVQEKIEFLNRIKHYENLLKIIKQTINDANLS